MKKYITKPEMVQAVQVLPENIEEIRTISPMFVEEIHPETGAKMMGVNVPTARGMYRASEGDFIVRGREGIEVWKRWEFLKKYQEG